MCYLDDNNTSTMFANKIQKFGIVGYMDTLEKNQRNVELTLNQCIWDQLNAQDIDFVEKVISFGKVLKLWEHNYDKLYEAI